MSTDSAPLIGKERMPNACGPCGAFRKEGGEYLPPTTHFGSCRHFVDQGVLWVTGSQERRERTRTGR